jgi:hypothetical protein
MTYSPDMIKVAIVGSRIVGVSCGLGTAYVLTWFITCLRRRDWGWACHALVVTVAWAALTWLMFHP